MKTITTATLLVLLLGLFGGCERGNVLMIEDVVPEVDPEIVNLPPSMLDSIEMDTFSFYVDSIETYMDLIFDSTGNFVSNDGYRTYISSEAGHSFRFVWQPLTTNEQLIQVASYNSGMVESYTLSSFAAIETWQANGSVWQDFPSDDIEAQNYDGTNLQIQVADITYNVIPPQSWNGQTVHTDSASINLSGFLTASGIQPIDIEASIRTRITRILP